MWSFWCFPGSSDRPCEVLDEMHQKDHETKVKLTSISPAVNNTNMLVDSISKFLTCFRHFRAMSASRTNLIRGSPFGASLLAITRGNTRWDAPKGPRYHDTLVYRSCCQTPKPISKFLIPFSTLDLLVSGAHPEFPML